MPMTGNVSTRYILQLFIFLSVLLGLVATSTAWAGDDIDIDRANWSSDRNRLTVRGEDAPDNSTVTLRYGEKDDNGAVIDTTEADGDGEWEFRITGLNPVPCDVTVVEDEDGEDDDKEVNNAPNNCSNDGGGGVDPNQPPTANPGGPYTGTAGVAVNFDGSASSDPDGTIASYAWSFGDGSTGTGATTTHTYATAGTYTVSLTVTDDGDLTDTVTTTATISDGQVACVETPGNGPQTHADCITSYTGPEVCVDCHEGQARDMHGSVHYQQGGAFPNATNIPLNFDAAGERPAQAAGDLVATGINTYCGTHENSPRFTCAGCHVGNGRFPMAESEFTLMDPASTEARAQLANIDCLMCHQDVYKRFPDWTANGEGFMDFDLVNLVELSTGELIQSNGDILPRTGFSGIPVVNPTTLDFKFLPAGSDTLPASVPMAPMALTTLEAAQTVHLTTRQSCLNCHAGAAGADGAKRGDLSHEVANGASTTTDFHLSPQGADLTCSDCHNAGGHRLRGRGLDLRPNDVSGRFTCDSCHSATPHGDASNTQGSSRDKHAQKVACQTCHIPSYGKAAVGTEVSRDWQDPHPSAAACNGRGGWLPREDKGADLIPSYAWFDGTSQVSYLGESLDGVPTVPLDAGVAASFAGNFNTGDPAYVIGMPNGDVAGDTSTKLYPMKEHWGKLARNDLDNTLIGHSTFEFFRTGSFCRAVAVGLGLDEVNVDPSGVCNGVPGNLEMPSNTTSVAVHTYQTINHGVEPQGDALNCGSCHSSQNGGPLQMDLGALGFGPRTLPSVVINTDQATLNGNLNNICSQCHGNENGGRGFDSVHSRHVQNLGKDCAACHNFSRPERGLSLSQN